MKLKTWVLPPQSRLARVCSAQCRALLEERFEPVWNLTGADYTNEQLSEVISEAEVLLTSWGSPAITADMLNKAAKLRFVGHAAGTIKGMVPQAIFSQGVKVFSAAPRIARSVGEYCLAVLLTLLRRLPQFDACVRQHTWRTPGLIGRELSGNTVGIVSASSTARVFIQLLAPFQTNIHVYDPYLTDEAAAGLGVRKASLEQVMSCPIISIHAPNLPATRNMITGEMLRLIPDGAILINSSRPTVLDERALIEELAKNRFLAALDVFMEEPLPANNPFTVMSNVLLTPHIAGGTVEGHADLMLQVAQAILHSMGGKPTGGYEVNPKLWEIIA